MKNISLILVAIVALASQMGQVAFASNETLEQTREGFKEKASNMLKESSEISGILQRSFSALERETSQFLAWWDDAPYEKFDESLDIAEAKTRALLETIEGIEAKNREEHVRSEASRGQEISVNERQKFKNTVCDLIAESEVLKALLEKYYNGEETIDVKVIVENSPNDVESKRVGSTIKESRRIGRMLLEDIEDLRTAKDPAMETLTIDTTEEQNDSIEGRAPTNTESSIKVEKMKATVDDDTAQKMATIEAAIEDLGRTLDELKSSPQETLTPDIDGDE